MDIYSIITTILTIIAGGGWFVYYKANKRIKEGEAVQSEAEGWAKQQDVYQETIANQQEWYNRLKNDFNSVMDENTQLRQENNELRKTINDLQNEIFTLKKDVQRLGRKVAAIDKEEKLNKKKGNNANDKTRK